MSSIGMDVSGASFGFSLTPSLLTLRCPALPFRSLIAPFFGFPLLFLLVFLFAGCLSALYIFPWERYNKVYAYADQPL